MPREGHDPQMLLYDDTHFQFQSTCPARGTTDSFNFAMPINFISIHVPREGHDTVLLNEGAADDEISIHVPREGHDCTAFLATTDRQRFQSTCPARGTTLRSEQ